MSKSSPFVCCVFLLVQDTVGPDPCPCDLNGSTHSSSSSSPSKTQTWLDGHNVYCDASPSSESPRFYFLKNVVFGPCHSQREREVSSLEANCRFARIVDVAVNHFQMGNAPPLPQVTWTASENIKTTVSTFWEIWKTSEVPGMKQTSITRLTPNASHSRRQNKDGAGSLCCKIRAEVRFTCTGSTLGV